MNLKRCFACLEEKKLSTKNKRKLRQQPSLEDLQVKTLPPSILRLQLHGISLIDKQGLFVHMFTVLGSQHFPARAFFITQEMDCKLGRIHRVWTRRGRGRSNSHPSRSSRHQTLVCYCLFPQEHGRGRAYTAGPTTKLQWLLGSKALCMKLSKNGPEPKPRKWWHSMPDPQVCQVRAWLGACNTAENKSKNATSRPLASSDLLACMIGFVKAKNKNKATMWRLIVYLQTERLQTHGHQIILLVLMVLQVLSQVYDESGVILALFYAQDLFHCQSLLGPAQCFKIGPEQEQGSNVATHHRFADTTCKPLGLKTIHWHPGFFKWCLKSMMSQVTFLPCSCWGALHKLKAFDEACCYLEPKCQQNPNT